MKNLFIILFTFIFSLPTIHSQKKAEFEIYFYFEDAIGARDTIFYRADTTIIDDCDSFDGPNVDWGEFVDNSPFDTILTARAKCGFDIGGDFYQNIILKSWDENHAGYNLPVRLAIFVYTKHWPVKMTWNTDYFKNHDRLYGSYATSDFYMTQKYLYNTPYPWNRQAIACLANDTEYIRDLRPDSLYKYKEIAYRDDHEVIGIGKTTVNSIMISFTKPWIGLCGRPTAAIDYNLEQVGIYPTIISNNAVIENHLNYNLKVNILSIEGNIIRTFPIETENATVDFSFLNPGIYLVRFTKNDGMYKTFKIIKE